jgi:hypothetical protein
MKPTWYALGAFEDDRALLSAIKALRPEIRTRIEAHTPYPVEGMDEALALGPSRVRWAGAVGGLLGAAGAYFTMWFTNAFDFPINVGGRPLHALPAFIPITFELGVLTSALFIFIGVLGLNGLPRLYHPVFDVDGFRNASIDGFWISIPAEDRQQAEALANALRGIGATAVHSTEARKR